MPSPRTTILSFCVFVPDEIFIFKKIIFHPLMPIRGLDQLKDIAHIATKRPCAVLQNTSIAVDGFWFLRKYLMPISVTHVLIHGLGKFYAGILDIFKKFVAENKIDVIWVWNGFEFSKSQAPLVHDPLRMGMDELRKGNFSLADKHLRKVIDLEAFVDEINYFLRKDTDRICCIRAPYSALGQCAYFLRNNVVDYVFGATDFLLYGNGEKVITEFNFLCKDREDRIEIFCRKDILKTLKLPFSKFQMYALFLGCEYCATMPPYSVNFEVFEILEVLRIGNYSYSGIKAYLYTFYGTDPMKSGYKPNILIDNYLNSFVCALALLDYHPIMSTEGRIELLKDTNVPRDLEDVLGAKKAAYFYEQLFLCNIKPDYKNHVGHRLTYLDKDGHFCYTNVEGISELHQFLLLELSQKNFFTEDILIKLLFFLDCTAVPADDVHIKHFLQKNPNMISYYCEITNLYACYVNKAKTTFPFSLTMIGMISVLSMDRVKEPAVVNYLTNVCQLFVMNESRDRNSIVVIKFLKKFLNS
ncbi:putative XPG/RAD2 endonuclease protein [Trachipleistophora hominis]|uniref:Putative XPG/RAD2 endonuclease protein n=1 Tax=Trachipleistophora hominis TaxID=72359 RepID=L7JV30_TRAHO|nr:putative XPG/RAD2 endonuclease protein [Trachipleistophora hominis]